MMGGPPQPAGYVAVGSNISPWTNIPRALEMMIRTPGVEVRASSTFFETVPVDRSGQDKFCNGVWCIQCEMPPRELKFGVLRQIETMLGRVRTGDPHAPRTIDLDLILWGANVVREDGLVIPDPDIRTRPFIAVPLMELDPGLIVPGMGTIKNLCEGLDRTGMRLLPELTEELRRKVTDG